MSEIVQTIYRNSDEVVRSSFGNDQTRALEHYAPLLDFVSRVQPPQGHAPFTRLLDVGCGSGWSTFAFAKAGYDATGIDLNAAAFEVEGNDACQLREGSRHCHPIHC